MGRKCLTGCGTAMFTPFRDGKVDVPSLIRQTREQVEAGMDFLVPLGTTGETPTLSDEEKLLVFRTVKAHSGILPVMVGVGTNSFEGTLSNMRLLAEADAYLVVVPYYNKPPQRGLLAYFQGLAAETDKPIVLYNVPGRTGTNLEAGTTLALSRTKNIIGKQFSVVNWVTTEDPAEDAIYADVGIIVPCPLKLFVGLADVTTTPKLTRWYKGMADNSGMKLDVRYYAGGDHHFTSSYPTISVQTKYGGTITTNLPSWEGMLYLERF